ncbi:hypothetical protein DWY69_23470 [Eisenbergiella massiliensis]|uniref:Uncharacterized protein n=1 Tax=Eisenbergiella massiliensis TaxID=1720294 RepID=A0A3E3II99_9FIRM|nr:hypothetical protein DWY69_23470 [Eisenbergiella massiliensis]
MRSYIMSLRRHYIIKRGKGNALYLQYKQVALQNLHFTRRLLPCRPQLLMMKKKEECIWIRHLWK